jgi:filamentous hemagglutinin
MNKHVHRLVFDRRRGMRVPAAEHARSAGKAGSGQTRAVVAAGVLSVLALGDAGAQLKTDASAAAGAVSRLNQVTWGADKVAGRVSTALNRTITLPKYTLDGLWKNNSGKYTNPVLSADGRTMTIKQEGQTIVLNWDSFDIGTGYTVTFDQPTGGRAFNTVDDVSAGGVESVINGTLSANGEVILQNRNGVIFGPSARVQVGSLVASALKVADDAYTKGFRAFQDRTAAFDGTLTVDGVEKQDGYIAVEKGAEIKALAGGDIIMVAPRVINKGNIEVSNGGQATLAAGRTVYLFAQADLAQRGMLVAVDNFATPSAGNADVGQVINEGTVQAEKGSTINLVGAAIRQKGRLTATTAVKGLNGGIYLHAMETAADGTLATRSNDVGGKVTGQAKLPGKLGVIEMAEGSVTEVLPSAEGLGVNANGQVTVLDAPKPPAALAADANEADKAAFKQAQAQYDLDLKAYEARTQTASDTFNRSRIDILGADITFRTGSTVRAPAGEVNVLAAQDWLSSSLYSEVNQAKRDNSLIRMEAGSVIDVSGISGLRVSGSRHQLKGRLFSIELADSPVQRDGVLYRSELLADARKVITVGDVSGIYNSWRYTAAELSTVGGVVRIQSQGFLDIQDDARVDFGGGSVVFDAAKVTSSLVAAASTPNSLVPIEDADKGTAYSRFISDPSKASAEELQRLGLSAEVSSSAANVPEILVGKSAGAAQVAAPSMRLDGQFDGSVQMSAQQRQSAVASGLVPGKFYSGSNDAAEAPDLFTGGWAQWSNDSHVLSHDPALVKSPHLYTTLRPLEGALVLGNDVGGANDLRVPNGYLNTSIRFTSGTDSGMNEAGEFELPTRLLESAKLGRIQVLAPSFALGSANGQDANLTLPAGARLDVTVRDGVSLDGKVTAQGGDLSFTSIKSNVSASSSTALDISGAVRDERFGVGAVNEAIDVDPGAITLSAGDGITLEAGSSLNVSAGAWRASGGGTRLGGAGTIALSLNTYRETTNQTISGKLSQGATLSGYDFDDGGTLKFSGLPSLTLNSASALYADRGFGTIGFSALGDVTVEADSALKPVLRNYQLLNVRQASDPLVAVETVEAGRRAGVKLSLEASTEPRAAGVNPTGLQAGADLEIGKGASIDVGAGGSVTLAAGGNIDVNGSITARGGSVKMGILGQRGSTPGSSADPEPYGWLDGQHIALGDNASIDVSGIFKSYRLDGAQTGLSDEQVRIAGTVLGGGAVTIGNVDGKAQRGRFTMASTASIKADGASGAIDFGRSVGKTAVHAAAGTINIGVTDGFQILGSLSAKATDKSVANGTLNISLSQERLVDNATSVAYPTTASGKAGTRSIRLTKTSAEADTLAKNSLKFGEGVIATDTMLNGGFDRLRLRADHSVQFNTGANLVADTSKRSVLQSVVLDAPLIELATQASTHSVVAHHVGLGQFSRAVVDKPALATAVDPAKLGTDGGLRGDGTFNVQAGLIELSGKAGIKGAQETNLSATLDRNGGDTRTNGEVRLIGAREANNSDLAGQFSYTGALNVRTGQMYATTLSNFDIAGFKGKTTDGKDRVSEFTLKAPAAGSTSQAPLSALATLGISASKVTLDGTVHQPFGAIEVKADNVELGASARLSVSGLKADGSALLVPVGTTVNQTQWIYATQGSVGSGRVTETLDPSTNQTLIDLGKKAVDKRVSLDGETLKLDARAVVDAQAGGDVLAWEFKAGAGGSTDTFNRKGVYAILPGYGYDFAPHDADINASSSKMGQAVKAGDQVTILTGSDVLAAGTYTLMDARYGVLPGAVLVQAATLNTGRPLTQAIQRDDGSVYASGYLGGAGSALQSSSPRQALLLEPESTFRRQSEVILTSGNGYVANQVARTGDAKARPGDGGIATFQSKKVFDFVADVKLGAKGDLRGGSLDLVMPDLVVGRTPAAAGAGNVVSLDRLNATGASSILLGGTRKVAADGDGVDVTRVSDTVTVRADAAGSEKDNTFSTQGELLLVAKSKVQVDDGVTIESTGADTGEARKYTIQDDGAALLVGNVARTDVAVTNVSDAPAGDLLLGDATAPGQVTLKGRAVQLDATGKLALDPRTVVQASSLGLGSQGVAVGATAQDQVDSQTLVVSGELLNNVNRAERLQLRAYRGIDFYRDVTLGSTGMQSLTLDTPLIRGVGTTSDTATIAAREIVLRNSTGRLANAQAKGSSTLNIVASPVLSDGRTGGLIVERNLSDTAAQAAVGQRLAFTQSVLSSKGDIVFKEKGSLSSQGALTLSADRLTATHTSDQAVKADGALTNSKLAGAKSLRESVGAGGTLSLQGDSVEQAGDIEIESGRLSLTGKKVTFTENSVTDVSGRGKQVSQTHAVVSHGGTIAATATAGNVFVDGTLKASAGKVPDVKGLTGPAADAGTVKLQANQADGAVVLGDQARIEMNAQGGQGGRLQVDAQRVLSNSEWKAEQEVGAARTAVSKLDGLMKAAAPSGTGAHHLVDVRVRSGDVSLDRQVKAATIKLTADGGGLTLKSGADLVADAERGGLVQLQAKGDLTLDHGSKVKARSTAVGGNGGDVLLSSTEGKVKLGDAEVLAHGKLADGKEDKGVGRIVVRASRNAAGDDLGVERLADDGNDNTKLTLTAGSVELVGAKVYESADRIGLISGANNASAWGLSTLHNEADTLTDNKDAILSRLNLGSATVVKAEAEIRSKAATFTLSGDLNYERASGKKPMNLTVRAEQDLKVTGNVSAGFTSPARVAANASTPTTMSTGDASSFRLVAGADTTSADLLAVKSDAAKGHLEVSGDKHIRTTAGSIELAASGDVRLVSSDVAGTPSAAIYVAGRLAALAEGESDQNRFKWAQYTERGGRLSVQAGRSVTSLLNDGKIEQSLSQLTSNYFFHAGPTESTVAWWTAFDSFRHGLGSFGGGNVLVSAGSDVRNTPVVSLTNAQSVGLASGATELRVRGGGDVEVRAGRDIAGGLYVLGRGEGRLTAGDELDMGASSFATKGAYDSAKDILPMGAMLGLMDGNWSVVTGGDLRVANVFNPTILPMPVTKKSSEVAGSAEPTSSKLAINGTAKQSLAGYYFTYGDDVGLALHSTRGDVRWQADPQSLQNIQRSNSSRFALESITDTTVMGYLTQAANFAPPVVHVTSLIGDVTFDAAGTVNPVSGERGSAKSLMFMPSDKSDVRVYAGRDARVLGDVQVLDWSQSSFLGRDLKKPFSSADYGKHSKSDTSLMESLNPLLSQGNNVKMDLSALVRDGSSSLTAAAGESARQAVNDRVISILAGRDLVFDAAKVDATTVREASLRTSRPAELIAGRDIVNPIYMGQNFTEDDVTRLSAGRDVIGLNKGVGAVVIGGPGQLRIEAGRDILLGASAGVVAVGNAVNQGLPAQGAKITLAAGEARTVNLAQATANHGSDQAFRAELRAAVVASKLPHPEGLASWDEASDEQVAATFATLKESNQLLALNRYLNARFVAEFMPSEANQDDAYYQSDAFKRKKHEVMWREAVALASQAVGLAVSSDAAEEARRKQRRDALFQQADRIIDLAGLGDSVNRSGVIDLANARVHNQAPGGGFLPGVIDDSQGGIDVIAADKVLVGLPSNDGKAHGFVNFDGGSFRSLTGGDFLAGDQKVIVSGRGNVFIYTTGGDIDSGKGSNTAVSATLPRRVFDRLADRVVTKGQPPLTGSGFQIIESPADVGARLGLYAPNGEIRALDAFITGPQVDIAANRVIGGDNIANAAGLPPAPTPTISISITPKLGDTQAGVQQASAATDERKQASADSQLTVELLGLGAEGEAAAAAAAGEAKPKPEAEDEKARKADKADKVNKAP